MKNEKFRLTGAIQGNHMKTSAGKYLSNFVADTAMWFHILKRKYYKFEVITSFKY